MDLEWPCSTDKLLWSSPCDVSSPAALGVQKRSRDEMGSSDEAEPASKRPALSTRLDDVNSQDVDIGDSSICPSPPGKFCSIAPGKFHVIVPPLPTLWDHEDGYTPIGSISLYTEELPRKETDGSYWYRMPSSNQQGLCSPSTSNEKLIQDMSLLHKKTFFHLNELINAKIRPMFSLDGEVELFARVVHTGWGISSCQSYQWFKLGDLFSGQLYMSGVMLFGKEESPIYCESSPFLAAKKTDDKCYCLCRLQEDEWSAFGWSLNILDIQPVSWETIRSAHGSMGKQG